MPLSSIPIHIVSNNAAHNGLSGNAEPLLYELAALIERLLQQGQIGAIDLSALPLTTADIEWLREQLGSGEISMTLDSQGTSTLQETALPGVWWVTHYNEQGGVLTQLLEVTFVPELAKAHADDVHNGYERLQIILGNY